MTQIRTLSGSGESLFKDKGSRFIGQAMPVSSEDDIRHILGCLKTEHPKARHICYAWRLGATPDCYRANDDGEPAGSAGRPILGRIDSVGLSDVLVTVVRYFGGTLLGVPGLIRAYKTAAADALAAAPVCIRESLCAVVLTCPWQTMDAVGALIRRLGAKETRRVADMTCTVGLLIAFDRLEELAAALPHGVQMTQED